MSHGKLGSRRAMLATTVAIAATPALAEGCEMAHRSITRARSYSWITINSNSMPHTIRCTTNRSSRRSLSTRQNSDFDAARIGAPQRVAYGPTEIEKLDIYRTNRANAPIFIFIHGGNWLVGSAKQYGYPAEMFINAGAHYVALDFISVKEAGGDLSVMAAQIRGGIAWVYKNAASFGGDPTGST